MWVHMHTHAWQQGRWQGGGQRGWVWVHRWQQRETVQEGQGQGEDGKTRTEGWRGSELTKMKARARAREQTDKEDTSSWRWRQVARDSGPDNVMPNC